MMEPNPKKRKLWDENSMVAAMEAVKNNTMRVAQAARHYSVPRKSLENRVKDHVVHGTLSGPVRVLNDEEEGALVEYIKYMAKGGFPMTRKIVCAYAFAIAKKSGRAARFNMETGPGIHWWSNFRKRHPQLSLRTADKLDRGRAKNANKQVIQEYFQLLENTLIENNIKDKCDRIYNCDETGMVFDSTNDKVVAPRGAKHVYSQSMGTREHITVHACACANGIILPPMIIFAKSFPGGAYTRGGPTNALYAKSESGYMDGELYMLWFERVFLKYCSKDRPVILVQDGHKSHITTTLIEKARQEGVILFNLPPHTTHATQPLDKNIFKPLKAAFATTLKSLTFARQDFTLAKSDFPRVFRDPFDRTCTPFRIKRSFSDAGICPFDPSQIKVDILGPSEHFQARSSAGISSPAGATPGPTSSPSVETTPTISSAGATPTISSAGATPTSTSTRGIKTPTSVAGDTPTSSESSRPCTPNNPLLEAGLIPESLADLLQVPQKKEQTVRRRIVTKARVITGEEYMEEVRRKDEEAKQKEEEKQRRKEEREQKKKAKEEERKRKEAEKGKTARARAKKTANTKEKCVPTTGVVGTISGTGTTTPGSSGTSGRLGRHRKPTEKVLEIVPLSSSESDDEEDDACFLCGKIDPPHSTGRSVEWICCRSCDRWYHEDCIPEPVDDSFVCHLCDE